MSCPSILLVLSCWSLHGPARVGGGPDELREEVERLGWDLTERERVPGVAIAVVRGGALAWVMGCGYADVETRREVDADTVFNIGSISKTVAAWGVMRLVEQGKLDLDAPLGTTLRGWKLPASTFDAQKVTLRRLLSHTAGLSLHGYPGFPPGHDLPTLAASLSGDTNGAGDVHLELEPGTRWQYSGGGFTLAQLLVEETTGQSFAPYMQESVLAPLHMDHSAYGWPPALLEASATPYDPAGAPLPRGGPCFTELAAAGLQTTAGDLARFAIASLARSGTGTQAVLRPETIELMESPVAPAPEYGLGYEVERRDGLLVVGHGGANDGWIARLSLVPASGDALVVLTNGSNGTRVVLPIERAWLEHVAAEQAEAARPAGAAR